MRASNDTGNTKLMITRKKEMAGMSKEKESKVGRKGRNTEENQEEIKKKEQHCSPYNPQHDTFSRMANR